MSRNFPSANSTPPCNQVCWEQLPSMSWRYTESVTHCGHRFDLEQRIWRWDTTPRSERKKAS